MVDHIHIYLLCIYYVFIIITKIHPFGVRFFQGISLAGCIVSEVGRIKENDERKKRKGKDIKTIPYYIDKFTLIQLTIKGLILVCTGCSWWVHGKRDEKKVLGWREKTVPTTNEHRQLLSSLCRYQ